MSYLIYNDIELQVTRTLDFRQSFEADPTNTDLLWTRFDLVVQGIYNPQATSYAADPSTGIPYQVEGSHAAITDQAIRHALSEPRQYLEYGVYAPNPAAPGGPFIKFPILSSPPANPFGGPGLPILAPCDAKNGPMPFSLNIKLMGEKTWYVQFGIRTWLNECKPGPQLGDDGGPGGLLLSNRYSRVHEVDKRDLTRIITTGRAIFRLDALLSQPNPMNVADFFRSYVLPGIPPTFQRQAIHVNVGGDGSYLDWSVIDQQKMNSGTSNSDYISYGVKDVQGRFTQSTLVSGPANLPGPMLHLNADLEVEGGAASSTASLEAFAIKLALQKFGLTLAGITDPRTQGSVTAARISESIGDRRSASLHMEMRVPVTNGGQAGLGMLRFDLLGMDNPAVFGVGGVEQVQPYADRGTRGVYNQPDFAAALQAACSAPGKPSGPKGDGVGNVGDASNDDPAPSVNVTVGEPLPNTANLVNSYPTPGRGQFDEYSVVSEYSFKSGMMMAPIAGAAGATDDDGNPLPTASYMQLALPTATLTSKVSATRIGDAPILPSPTSSDSNMVLLGYFPKPYGVTLAADGTTAIYKAEMEITWGLKRPPDPTSLDGPPHPSMPWVNLPFGSASSYYENGIVDPGSNGNGSPGGNMGGGDDGRPNG